MFKKSYVLYGQGLIVAGPWLCPVPVLGVPWDFSESTVRISNFIFKEHDPIKQRCESIDDLHLVVVKHMHDNLVHNFIRELRKCHQHHSRRNEMADIECLQWSAAKCDVTLQIPVFKIPYALQRHSMDMGKWIVEQQPGTIPCRQVEFYVTACWHYRRRTYEIFWRAESLWRKSQPTLSKVLGTS